MICHTAYAFDFGCDFLLSPCTSHTRLLLSPYRLRRRRRVRHFRALTVKYCNVCTQICPEAISARQVTHKHEPPTFKRLCLTHAASFSGLFFKGNIGEKSGPVFPRHCPKSSPSRDSSQLTAESSNDAIESRLQAGLRSQICAAFPYIPKLKLCLSSYLTARVMAPAADEDDDPFAESRDFLRQVRHPLGTRAPCSPAVTCRCIARFVTRPISRCRCGSARAPAARKK
jgi:hypothetical protein